jgi:hypothetical protein
MPPADVRRRAHTLRHRAILCVAVLASLAATCDRTSAADITRERAIEIARSQVSFESDSIDASRETSNRRPVWQVTFRGRLPGQPPGLFEIMIVDVDRRTGEIVSVARN